MLHLKPTHSERRAEKKKFISECTVEASLCCHLYVAIKIELDAARHVQALDDVGAVRARGGGFGNHLGAHLKLGHALRVATRLRQRFGVRRLQATQLAEVLQRTAF